MAHLGRLTRNRFLALFMAALACGPAAAAPAPQASAAIETARTALEFTFDYELAKFVSQAIATGEFSDDAFASIRAHPATGAMVRKSSAGAVFALLKDDPAQFVLRYQAIAASDPALPKFSDEFIRTVKAL